MAGRKLSFNPETALNQMMLVFWTKGYSGTSIDDLCRAVGVPKPSIYSYFGDKETILIKALEAYNANSPQVNPGMWQMQKPFKERLIQLLIDTDYCDANPHKKMSLGCLMVNIITEFMGASEKIDEVLLKFSKNNEAGLKKFFDLAKERNELKKGLDPKILATQVSIFVCGLAILRKSGVSRKKVREHIENYVELILT